MADDLILKVNSEVMKKVSDEAYKNINAAKTTFEEVETSILGMSKYWQGKGYDAMQKLYISRREEYENAFKSLEEHVNKLNEMAGVYEETELDNVELPSVLPNDIIF